MQMWKAHLHLNTQAVPCLPTASQLPVVDDGNLLEGVVFNDGRCDQQTVFSLLSISSISPIVSIQTYVKSTMGLQNGFLSVWSFRDMKALSYDCLLALGHPFVEADSFSSGSIHSGKPPWLTYQPAHIIFQYLLLFAVLPVSFSLY